MASAGAAPLRVVHEPDEQRFAGYLQGAAEPAALLEYEPAGSLC